MKVLTACGSGMGSSQIIKMKVTRVFNEKNIPIEIHHCEIGEAKTIARNYDIVFCSKAFIDLFEGMNLPGTKIVGLKNLLSEREIEIALERILND